MELDLALGLFAEKGDRIIRQLDGMGVKPIYKTVGSNTVAAATGPDYVIIRERPAAGRIWNILGVGIFGGDDHTTIANGQAVFYSSTNPDNFSGVPPIIDVITSPLAIPQTQWFSKQVVWCQSTEYIFAVTYGVGGNQTLSAIANVAEYPLDAVSALAVG